jgi:hypothetical protein
MLFPTRLLELEELSNRIFLQGLKKKLRQWLLEIFSEVAEKARCY